jgi:glucose dehydrogenase
VDVCDDSDVAKDPGAETWENESWRKNGHANVWAPMALDEKRGLLYLPTSTPTSDYYGGQRPGANLFAESLVCLDAATGKIKWHFQTVHHGLWDWDIPTQPNLVTITVNGKQIDAVAQVTKRGDTFVFDRVTGTPVWPIVERPVPTDSDVPGEKPYPTQPFPTRPAPFVDPRRLSGRCQQSDAGDPQARAGADAEVPHRSDVHDHRRSRGRCSDRARVAAQTGVVPRSIRIRGI